MITPFQRDPNALYRMPNPVRLKHEGGMIGDPRVPPPVISDEEPLDIHKVPNYTVLSAFSR